MIDYRAFLSQIGSNDFVEGCPFVHYMPFLDPGSTPDLLIHCGLFGLFDFIKRQVSHLVSETTDPLACLLTSGTTVGQEAELDDGTTIVVRREPEALVLHHRQADSTRLHPQSIYHRSNLSRFFGLVESQQREWLYRRHVFGVATEPLDEEQFYSERAQVESLDRAARRLRARLRIVARCDRRRVRRSVRLRQLKRRFGPKQSLAVSSPATPGKLRRFGAQSQHAAGLAG